MIPYLITFSVSTIFGVICNGATGRRKILFLILALAPICILAAGRASTVGTDVRVYAIAVYNTCCSSSLLGALSSDIGSQVEVGFTVFSWIVCSIIPFFPFYLLAIEVAVVAPVAFVVFKSSPRDIGIPFAIFQFVLGCYTFNVIRQSIGASILLLGLYDLLQGNNKKYCLFQIVAISFHYTSVIGILFPIIQKISNKSDLNLHQRRLRREAVYLLILTMATALLIAFSFGDQLVQVAYLVKASYSVQAERVGTGSFNESIILFAMVLLLFYLLFKQKIKDRYTNIYIAVTILGCICMQLEIVASSLGRLGFTYLFCLPVAIGKISEALSDKSSRMIFNLAMLLVAIGYYFVVYVNGGLGGVIPYVAA